MNLNIYERIRLHEIALSNLNAIQQMTECEKQFIADSDFKRAKEALRIKNTAIDAYANNMQLLCEPHVEHALAGTNNHLSQLTSLS